MDAQSVDTIIGKKTLESLNPRILDPFLPTNWEENLKFLAQNIHARFMGTNKHENPYHFRVAMPHDNF